MQSVRFSSAFCLSLILGLAPPVSAQEMGTTGANVTSIYPDIPQFGGPTSVGGQLAEDAARVPQYRLQTWQELLDGWYWQKEVINDGAGLQFNIDESMFYQLASSSLGERDAASGLFRAFGQWELLGRGTGCPGLLVFKAENRHKLGTAITPFELGFEAGSILPTGTFFNEFSFGVTNLFWKQYFADRRVAFVIGRIDVTDFVDVYAMMNPLTHFINLAFSTNPTIAVPNQGLGVAAGGMLTERLYVQGGFSDANGQPTTAGFNTFFDDAEYFKYVEFGATSSQDRIYLDNIHVTLWHTDARQAVQTPEGWGVAFSAEKFINDKWLPFVRFGYANGDASLMQSTLSTGLGLQRENRDVAGIGLSWGQPADGTLRDQFTSEFFYRFQLTQSLAITPDVQLIADPALNLNTDVLALFGLRLRAVF
ncbi:MAG: carbohydrate porin [Planctomycetota bacterium]